MSKKVDNIRKRIMFLMLAALLCGCGQSDKGGFEAGQSGEQTENNGQKTIPERQPITGIAYETAEDAAVDFKALQSENPDIFAWLYIPGTEIDAPVLQSTEADDYYENHNAYGADDCGGALYTELANLKSMCDFNTVIHGKRGEKGWFADLYQFADQNFFEQYEDI